jgi:hypothetical protein
MKRLRRAKIDNTGRLTTDTRESEYEFKDTCPVVLLFVLFVTPPLLADKISHRTPASTYSTLEHTQ